MFEGVFTAEEVKKNKRVGRRLPRIPTFLSRGDALSPTLQELGIDRLSTEDRLSLAEAIWESVAREVEKEALPAGQREELERRLADSVASPEAVTPWEVIKERALARARQ